MRNRTFEILARWVCNELGVSVEFKENLDCPRASPSQKKIELPINIKGDNPYSATAVVCHEAGHIKSTSDKLCKEVCKSVEDKEIHNVMEDIRIDRECFNLLNNMREFYRILYEEIRPSKEVIKELSPMKQALMKCIPELEGLSECSEFMPKVKGVNYKELKDELEKGIYALDIEDKKELREAIERVKEILKVKDTKEIDWNAQAKGQGNPGGGQSQGNPVDGDGSSGWGKEHILQQDRAIDIEIPTHTLREMTRQRFCELLKETIRRYIPKGNGLNTKKLSSFYTGDLDVLFREQIKRKRFHSKILFLLDQSGSMNDHLLDGAHKWKTMCKILKPILELVSELKEAEGIAIDFEVWTFDTEIIQKYDIDNIHTLYKTGPMGGTCIESAFGSAQEYMLTDQTLNGRKMILMATDGGVSDGEIENVKKQILKLNEDVRCILMGIGAEQYAGKELLKHNIVAECVAEDIILQAISEML